jgi:hypothetical protein
MTFSTGIKKYFWNGEKMPRRKMLNVEKEIEKCIANGCDIRPYLKEIKSYIESIDENLQNFDAGMDFPGRKIRVKLSKAISLSHALREIIQAIRHQRRIEKGLKNKTVFELDIDDED